MVVLCQTWSFRGFRAWRKFAGATRRLVWWAGRRAVRTLRGSGARARGVNTRAVIVVIVLFAMGDHDSNHDAIVARHACPASSGTSVTRCTAVRRVTHTAVPVDP
eukprot:7305199-Prymnesium_polylepis.1